MVALCGVFIPIFGIPSLYVALVLFAAVNPDYYATNLPSISRTVSIPPASTIFVAYMIPAVTAITIFWIGVGKVNLWRIKQLELKQSEHYLFHILNIGAAFLGVIAGLSLLALAIVTLELHLGGHMVFSYLFFVSQILAFLVDSAFTHLISKKEQSGPARLPSVSASLAKKNLLAIAVCAAGILYYVLFLLKDFDLGKLQIIVQAIYVTNEYVLCTMLFSYSLFYVPLIRSVQKVRLGQLSVDPVATKVRIQDMESRHAS